ncbi:MULTISPECIES: DotU family type IV/VI secretion system protein [unclassified Pseudomonas]|uniref:DotU family type IV/VI secretion system protein n=1 Tax=unclassified Pseudomonas TaxID=196821 RepID=UPI00380F0282
MMQEPKRFKDVLEFMYYCVCLGLKGKYAIEPRGEESLQCLIMDLYAIIRELRGPVGASYVDQVVARYGGNSVTGKGAAATLGRLKLWGASLAGIGGLVLSWWDFADWKDHYTENRHGPTPQSRRRSSVIAIAYAARGVATISLSLAELGTAIAIAKPFFDYLTLTSENKLIRILGSTMSELSASLGSQTARLLLARLVLGAFWIGLAITVLIIIFDDDALEKWCKQSIYRSNRAHNKVLAEKIELKALFSAVRGVI